MHQVVFLDRDGTINVQPEAGYVAKIADWEFLTGVFEGLKLLKDAGFILALVTNQTGIGRGLYTQADMQRIHEHMQDELGKHGVALNAIAFCPHDPDDLCTCRKPKPDMASHIARQIGAIDYGSSWMIGDRIVDLQFGFNIGVQTALINSGKWQESELATQPDLIVDSLYDFAQQIT